MEMAFDGLVVVFNADTVVVVDKIVALVVEDDVVWVDVVVGGDDVVADVVVWDDDAVADVVVWDDVVEDATVLIVVEEGATVVAVVDDVVVGSLVESSTATDENIKQDEVVKIKMTLKIWFKNILELLLSNNQIQ